MRNISAQLKNNTLIPFTEIDKEILKEYQENQVVRLKITATRKYRSVKQLRTYWAACKLLANNTADPVLTNANKVDWQIRNTLQFFDTDYTFVDNKGNVTFKVRSIAFKNLKHIEACGYFDKAFELMAAYLGVDVDVFIDEVKKSIGG